MSERDLQMQTIMNQKLVETGERERLIELLSTRLNECGWRDQLRSHCKDVVREKGLDNVTVDDLITEVTPKGRALVPDSVKKEFLLQVKAFLTENLDY